MVILVFLHGTVIKHQTAEGKSRQQIIEQVKLHDPSVRDYWNYIPIGKAAKKLRTWVSQGTTVAYLSSLTEDKHVRGDEVVGREGLKADQEVLERYGFPSGPVYHRNPGERYVDLVERMNPKPDVLIEDDCQSIGGEWEMVYPHLSQATKQRIHSIHVKEFEGIDHLPDSIDQLVRI